MLGIGMDFAQGLALPAQVRSERRVFFYPGSSIGNFAPDEALRLLKHVRAADAGDGALLIGIDHPKPRELLEPAYDDALGVTAAFNLNVLRHVNRLLGSDFDVRQWQHVAFYDGRAARIEMHLQARCALGVRWPGAERRFAAGARIHTENSYKYSVDAVSDLLVSAGYPHITGWRDERGWFGVYLAHG
jgi:dimethylhistidine N-methyltransferase